MHIFFWCCAEDGPWTQGGNIRCLDKQMPIVPKLCLFDMEGSVIFVTIYYYAVWLHIPNRPRILYMASISHIFNSYFNTFPAFLTSLLFSYQIQISLKYFSYKPFSANLKEFSLLFLALFLTFLPKTVSATSLTIFLKYL